MFTIIFIIMGSIIIAGFFVAAFYRGKKVDSSQKRNPPTDRNPS
jgi:FtsZ-interacting cell division protein ZipA